MLRFLREKIYLSKNNSSLKMMKMRWGSLSSRAYFWTFDILSVPAHESYLIGFLIKIHLIYYAWAIEFQALGGKKKARKHSWMASVFLHAYSALDRCFPSFFPHSKNYYFARKCSCKFNFALSTPIKLAILVYFNWKWTPMRFQRN